MLIFSSLVCAILYWFWKEKVCFAHCLEWKGSCCKPCCENIVATPSRNIALLFFPSKLLKWTKIITYFTFQAEFLVTRTLYFKTKSLTDWSLQFSSSGITSVTIFSSLSTISCFFMLYTAGFSTFTNWK